MSFEEFKKYWDNEIKPFAEKICKMENLKDGLAQYYIDEMIFYVEHDLGDGRNPGFRMLQVDEVFNDESYYEDVFDGNEEIEEVKSYRRLGEMLNRGLKMLK